MTVMKKTEQKDDAVSPVVGVMLMLVVTIIIAAVVAAFASGLATSSETAPTAVLKSKVDSTFNYGGGTVFLTSLSGESIDLENVVVNVYNSTNHQATFTHPSGAGGAGQYLESGETVNLFYGIGDSYSKLSDLGVVVKPGELAQVVVIYDNTHVLYDEEVVVV